MSIILSELRARVLPNISKDRTTTTRRQMRALSNVRRRLGKKQRRRRDDVIVWYTICMLLGRVNRAPIARLAMRSAFRLATIASARLHIHLIVWTHLSIPIECPVAARLIFGRSAFYIHTHTHIGARSSRRSSAISVGRVSSAAAVAVLVPFCARLFWY